LRKTHGETKEELGRFLKTNYNTGVGRRGNNNGDFEVGLGSLDELDDVCVYYLADTQAIGCRVDWRLPI